MLTLPPPPQASTAPQTLSGHLGPDARAPICVKPVASPRTGAGCTLRGASAGVSLLPSSSTGPAAGGRPPVLGLQPELECWSTLRVLRSGSPSLLARQDRLERGLRRAYGLQANTVGHFQKPHSTPQPRSPKRQPWPSTGLHSSPECTHLLRSWGPWCHGWSPHYLQLNAQAQRAGTLSNGLRMATPCLGSRKTKEPEVGQSHGVRRHWDGSGRHTPSHKRPPGALNQWTRTFPPGCSHTDEGFLLPASLPRSCFRQWASKVLLGEDGPAAVQDLCLPPHCPHS